MQAGMQCTDNDAACNGDISVSPKSSPTFHLDPSSLVSSPIDVHDNVVRDHNRFSFSEFTHQPVESAENNVTSAHHVGEAESTEVVMSASVLDVTSLSRANTSTTKLFVIDEARSENKKTCTCGEGEQTSGRCVRFIARYPYVPMFLLITVIGAMTAVCYKWQPLPDFSDEPTRGFETRGTPIVSRARTLANLEWQFRRPADTRSHYFVFPNTTFLQEQLSSTGLSPFLRDDSLKTGDQNSNNHGRQRRDFRSECIPREILTDSTKFVLEAVSKDTNLFNAASLRDICTFSIRRVQPYLRSWCPVKSLAFYVAALRDKPCSQINDDDVTYARSLLDICSGFYYNKTLQRWTKTPDALALGMPADCVKNNFVFNTLHYLTDAEFSKRSGYYLKYTLLYFDSLVDSAQETAFYDRHLAGKRLEHGSVRLVAVDMRFQQIVKARIFGRFIVSDLWYFGLAMILTSLLLFFYLRSFVLLVATFINVLLSLSLANFIYYFVFRFTFFPFINLLAGLLLIAVGSDDVFIFYDAWQLAQTSSCPHHGTARALSRAYSHAGMSIVVTSLTTASAFFVNFVSSITAIRCFSVFAGLSMLANLLVMLTWTPSVIVALDAFMKFIRRCSAFSRLSALTSHIIAPVRRSVHWFYSHALPSFVHRTRIVCIVLLLSTAVGAAIIVFVSPGLHLPNSVRFQVLDDSNLFEKWDQKLRQRFRAIEESDERRAKRINVYFVFGFVAGDTGSQLQPASRYDGSYFTYDKEDRDNDNVDSNLKVMENSAFDIYSESHQLWMLRFCKALKSQQFTVLYGVELCGLDAYARALSDLCPYVNITLPFSPLAKCCTRLEPPFTSSQLRMCMPFLQYYVQRYPLAPNSRPLPIFGLPIFNASNVVKGYMFNIGTNLSKSLSYSVMRDNYEQLRRFMQEQLTSAPKGMRSSFHSSAGEFLFYDLQRALARGTYISVALSLAVAFVMMLMTTLNPLITVFAIGTIGVVIFCTVAAIVLLGWSLNIVESVIISLAVGLSIDFTIHYGVAYRLSTEKDSAARVRDSFKRVGVAVTTAALTTFTSGAAMLPCTVLVYRQLGIFLMIVMSFSWLFATFLFQPLCLVSAPHRCQLLRCKQSNKYDVHAAAANDLVSECST